MKSVIVILVAILIATFTGCGSDANPAGTSQLSYGGLGGRWDGVRSDTNSFLRLVGDGSHVNLPESSSLLGFPTETGQITIEAWIRIRKSSNYMLIISTGNQNDYLLGVEKDLKVQALIYPCHFRESVEFELGLWQHVAFSYDGSTARFYLNGQLDTTILVGRTPIATSQSRDIRIGAYYGFESINTDMDADMDEIRVWKIARTPDQIAGSIYSLKTNDRTGLVGYWKFDGDFNDSSINGNHGTEVGSPQIVRGRVQ